MANRLFEVSGIAPNQVLNTNIVKNYLAFSRQCLDAIYDYLSNH